MQSYASSFNKSREAAEPHPLIPTIDPELEGRISSILNRIPPHLKASAAQKNINQTKTSLSEVLQNGPFTRSVPLQSNALAKHSDLLINTQFFQPESQKQEVKADINIDKKQVKASRTPSDQSFPVTNDKKSPEVTHQIDKATSLREYQDVLNQRVENALRRSQVVTRSVDQLPSIQKIAVTVVRVQQPEKELQSLLPFQYDSEKLNHRVEEALKRSENNLKRSGVYQSIARSISHSNDYGFLSPSHTRHVQNHYEDISALESRYKAFSSPSNILKISADRGNIEAAFNEALKRSETLLKQNEVVSRQPVTFTKTADIKTNNLYTSLVQEKFTSSIGFSHVHRTPPKEKNLHIFHNAIKTLSPAGIYSPQNDLKPTFANEQLEDGASYEGEVLGRKKHGRGILQYKDGGKYDGEWEDGEKSGYGTQTQPNGDVLYQGEWNNGQYHGSGVLYNSSAENAKEAFDYSSFSSLGDSWERYEGEFGYGRWHGLGTLYLRNGEKFVGKFRNGQVHGKGTFYQSNGKNVTGEWQGDKFAGAL